MTDKRTGFNARQTAFLQETGTLHAAKELLRTEEFEDFVTVLNFLEPQQAVDWANTIFKCRRHKLWEQEKRFWLIAKAMVAVKGRRADLYAQTLAQLMVPEFFGGKAETSKDGHKP